MNKFTHLDLFSGIGGFAVAVDSVWGNAKHIFCDNDKFCRQVLKKQFPKSKVVGDIRKLVLDLKNGISIMDLCQENSVHDAKKKNEPLTHTGEKNVLPKPLEIGFMEAKNGTKNTRKESENIPQDYEKRLLVRTEESVCVVGKKNHLFSQSTTETEEGQKKEKQKRVRDSPFTEALSKETSQIFTNFSATTAITENTDSENALINYEHPFILTAGVPCQPASQAGKRNGKKDDRWLWPETFAVIRITKPNWIILENVRGILTLGQGVVFEELCVELENCGYEIRTFIIPAVAVNAPHRRDRVWFVAHSKSSGSERRSEKICEENGGQNGELHTKSDSPNRDASDTNDAGSGTSESGIIKDRSKDCEERKHSQSGDCGPSGWDKNWLEVATELCGVFNGLSKELDEIMNDVIYLKHAKTIKKITGQDLPHLWELFQSKKVQWQVGRFSTIQNEDYLFTILWKLAQGPEGQNYPPFESAEVQEAYLRNLWFKKEAGCPPHRFEYQKQYAEKYKDTLPSLSHEIALVAEEVWRAYNKDRVERLKSLGNSIVPQVAIEIMKAIKYSNEFILK